MLDYIGIINVNTQNHRNAKEAQDVDIDNYCTLQFPLNDKIYSMSV